MSVHTELLLLPDGRILVHNLTPAMAEILHRLFPADQMMRQRSAAVSAAARPMADGRRANAETPAASSALRLRQSLS